MVGCRLRITNGKLGLMYRVNLLVHILFAIFPFPRFTFSPYPLSLIHFSFFYPVTYSSFFFLAKEV